MLSWDLAAFALAGVAAGFVSGLMGVGGGIVMTPVLHYILKQPWHEAVALSLFAIALQSPLGLYRHHRKGAVSWRLALPLVAGGAAGVVVGVWLEPRIGVPWLKLAFAGAMVFAAVRLIQRPRLGHAHLRAPVLAGIGFGAGVISRLLGIGGGLVTVPVLALSGVAIHVAVGSSLVPVFSNAAVATLGNVGRDLPWLGGLLMAGFALAGAWMGVESAHKLPETGLRRIFAGALFALAAYVAATSGVWMSAS